jgi:hypothetical protein
MILYACSDLIFSTKIRSTAESLGVDSAEGRDIDTVIQRMEDGGPPVTALLVDLELGDEARTLIEQTKREYDGIVVIGFGSHVEKETLQAARDVGADHVWPRSRFTNELPNLLERIG